MNKEDIKFEIDQNRKQSMLSALISVSTSLAVFMLVSFMSILDQTNAGIIVFAGLIIAVGFWLFGMYGNLLRWLKIRRLEKHLHRS